MSSTPGPISSLGMIFAAVLLGAAPLRASADVIDVATNLAPANSGTSTPGAPAVGTNGQDFLVVTCRQAALGAPSGLIGVRMSAAGSVLGEFTIAPHDCSLDPQTAVGFDGSNYLVSYLAVLGNLQNFVRGVRVTPAGQVLDASGGFDISSGAGFSHGHTGIAYDGTSYLVVWRRFTDNTDRFDVIGARVTPAGQALGEFMIAGGAEEQTDPSVIYAGNRFLVLWRSSMGSGPNSTSDVYATRVATNGTVLDPSGIPVATKSGIQTPAGTATDGVNILAVWTEHDTAGSPPVVRIRARRMTPGGDLLDGDADSDGIVVNDAPFGKGEPVVAFDGSDFVIAWRVQGFNLNTLSGIYTTRVTRSGALVGEPASAIGVAVSGTPPDFTKYIHPRLAFNASAGLALWVKNIELSGQTKTVQGLLDFRQCFLPWEHLSLARGNQWTYQKNGSTLVAATVSTAADDIDVVGEESVRTLVFSDGSTESFTADCLGVRLHGATNDEGSTLTYSPPAVIAPLKLSGTVVSSGRVLVSGAGDGVLDYDASSQILGTGSVSVPAGQFDALKVRITYAYTGPGGNISQVQTYWSVPHVGIVKVIDKVDGAIDTYELVSTQVDTDADTVEVSTDNCPVVANSDQIDTDLDGIGNACDDDDDNDGLSDTQEISLGTDPLKADTDGDGTSDGDEVAAGRNPLVNEGSVIIPILIQLLSD